MPLKLRPTGLGSGIDKDRPDYTAVTGDWEVGRIYQSRGGPDSLRWFWSMTVNGPMTRSDRVATLDEAKAQFQKSWKACALWDRLSRAYALVRRESPAEMIQEEMEALRAMLDERRSSELKKS